MGKNSFFKNVRVGAAKGINALLAVADNKQILIADRFKKQVLHVVDVLTFVDHDLVIVGAQLFGRLGAGVCMGFVIVVFDQQLQCQM